MPHPPISDCPWLLACPRRSTATTATCPLCRHTMCARKHMHAHACTHARTVTHTHARTQNSHTHTRRFTATTPATPSCLLCCHHTRTRSHTHARTHHIAHSTLQVHCTHPCVPDVVQHDVAAALNTRVATLLLKAAARSAPINMSQIQSLCVRGCVQLVACVAALTAPAAAASPPAADAGAAPPSPPPGLLLSGPAATAPSTPGSSEAAAYRGATQHVDAAQLHRMMAAGVAEVLGSHGMGGERMPVQQRPGVAASPAGEVAGSEGGNGLGLLPPAPRITVRTTTSSSPRGGPGAVGGVVCDPPVLVAGEPALLTLTILPSSLPPRAAASSSRGEGGGGEGEGEGTSAAAPARSSSAPPASSAPAASSEPSYPSLLRVRCLLVARGDVLVDHLADLQPPRGSDPAEPATLRWGCGFVAPSLLTVLPWLLTSVCITICRRITPGPSLLCRLHRVPQPSLMASPPQTHFILQMCGPATRSFITSPTPRSPQAACPRVVPAACGACGPGRPHCHHYTPGLPAAPVHTHGRRRRG